MESLQLRQVNLSVHLNMNSRCVFMCPCQFCAVTLESHETHFVSQTVFQCVTLKKVQCACSAQVKW